MADVGNVRRDWERLGEEDPLWAVLSSEGKRGGNWDEAEFFRTGVEFVDQLMPDVAVHLPGQVLGDALDFGCGVGRLSQPLGGHFRTVTGVDVSAAMLDRARAANTADNITFVHNTAADLGVLADQSFDFVLSFIVLQHMPPALIRSYLAEFHRVLRPGGGLFFSLPSRPAATPRGVFYRVVPQSAIVSVMRLRRGAGMRMSHIPAERLTAFLTSTGFEVTATRPSTSAGPNWSTVEYFGRKPG